MAAREADERRSRAALLTGAGARAREVAAVLNALARLDVDRLAADGVARPPTVVNDLAELLVEPSEDCVLILEAGGVPSEDIGLVRRFLERHSRRRLVVLAAERDEARALLALPRASFLAWPPSLEDLRALVPPPATLARGREEPRSAPRAKAPNGRQDLRSILEELFAGAALLGGGAVRFQLRSSEACEVPLERHALLEGLGGLVELARRCAGADGLVRAAVDQNGEAVLIGLEFPRATLSEKELPTLLERAPAAPGELAEGLTAARRGSERLRALGARLELSSCEPGRVRCEVRLPLGPRPPSAQKTSRWIKPEDPFA
jgi:hypothetical protein